MTIFDWLQRLEFLRGEPAAWLVGLTAVMVVVVPDARLALLALAGHYFAALLLFVDVLDPRLAIVKLLVGWFACLILYLTGRQANWGRVPEDLTQAESAQWRQPQTVRVGRYRLPLWAVRILLAGLSLPLVLWLSGRPNVYLPLLPDNLAYLNLAVMALLVLGLLHMALAVHPLEACMGALLFLTGFELFYSSLDQSLAALTLLAAVNLTVALATAYLAQAQYEKIALDRLIPGDSPKDIFGIY